MSTRLELPDTTWRRVSRKLMWAELVGTFLGALFFLAGTIPLHLLQIPFALAISIVVAVSALITLVLVPRRVRAIGYQLRDDDLLFRRGIMFLRFVAVPYGRMQLVDINRGPIDRFLGLSELRFVTAAASTGVTIPGLEASEADALRDKLVALAESRRAGL